MVLSLNIGFIQLQALAFYDFGHLIASKDSVSGTAPECSWWLYVRLRKQFLSSFIGVEAPIVRHE